MFIYCLVVINLKIEQGVSDNSGAYERKKLFVADFLTRSRPLKLSVE